MFHTRFHSTLRLAKVLPVILAFGAAGTASVATANTHGFSYTTDGKEFEYAIFDGEGAATMSTHDRDFDRIGEIGRRYDGHNFWFALEGTDYLVHDPALYAKAKKIVEPMQEIGERQGKLGAQQSEIGGRQSAIGARQGEIGARMGRIASRIAILSVHSAGYGNAEDDRRVRDLQRDMDRLQAEQNALQEKQEPLAQQQEKLGAQQEALGKQQERATKIAARDLGTLARQAIQAGKAERLP
jgi:bla regulator protein BlaR1